ncbi:DUF559 domain-containing protein [Microcella putealis]|nr:DUF559 domain-containing protein [Microcella putealis]
MSLVVGRLVNRLQALGGVASVRELCGTPAEQRALARASERGILIRARRGVYALPELPRDVLLAASVGGRLTGVSALVHHGLWVPPPTHGQMLHVEVRVSMSVTDRPSSTRVWWTREKTIPQFGVAPLEPVLAVAAASLPREWAVAVLDSALRRTPLTPRGLAAVAATWSPPARRAASLTDIRSESGTESALRVLLGAAGIRTVPQPRLPIADFARADLLVGDRLLIECDSEEHHAAPERRRADLARDSHLVSLGFIVLRFDYRRVFADPAEVVAEISAVVERGDHLSARPTAR